VFSFSVTQRPGATISAGMTATIQTIRDDFSLLDEWEDRYRYLIELGEALPPFPEAERTPANKVPGCVSQVWLTTCLLYTSRCV